MRGPSTPERIIDGACATQRGGACWAAPSSTWSSASTSSFPSLSDSAAKAWRKKGLCEDGDATVLADHHVRRKPKVVEAASLVTPPGMQPGTVPYIQSMTQDKGATKMARPLPTLSDWLPAGL